MKTWTGFRRTVCRSSKQGNPPDRPDALLSFRISFPAKKRVGASLNSVAREDRVRRTRSPIWKKGAAVSTCIWHVFFDTNATRRAQASLPLRRRKDYRNGASNVGSVPI